MTMIPDPSAPRLPGRFERLARSLRGLAHFSQILVLIALFVLWKEVGLSFWTSVEYCVVGGIAVYTALMTAASVLHMLSPGILLGHLTRAVMVGIYSVLRCQQSQNIISSGAVLAVLYAASSFVVRKMEQKARSRFGI